jgi:hypothetical protein
MYQGEAFSFRFTAILSIIGPFGELRSHSFSSEGQALFEAYPQGSEKLLFWPIFALIKAV